MIGLSYPDYIAGAGLLAGAAALWLAFAVTYPGPKSFSFERFMRRRFSFKEIGWEEVGEIFTRYAILKTRWFNVYLHQLYAPQWHPECHDHPWSFLTVLLHGGYLERIIVKDPGLCRCGEPHYRNKDVRRFPGMILWRPATFTHSVITPYGVSWSLIITGPKSNAWGFRPCNRPTAPTKPYGKYIAEHTDGI